MDVGLIMMLVIGFLYIYLFLSKKAYLVERFIDPNLVAAATVLNTKTKESPKVMTNSPPINTGELKRGCRESIFVEQEVEAPYVNSAIMDVDDYDYNLVFQNEGDREVSQKMINKLKSQYPMDWSINPPSSATFQAGMKRMKESFKDAPAQPKGMDPYNEITELRLQPPDTTLQETEERKILQTYQPKSGGDLTTYNVNDAETLISKIYDAKGLIASVVKTQPNVYEVVGTRRKDQKILYEDEEAPAQRAPVARAGEANITVPVTAVDVAAGLDPFYSTGSSSHVGRWDYQRFTPGLERMFAPTYPTAEWS
jgi:hypothetical protein